MSDYVPLREALKGYFGKQLDELPTELRRPVAELFYPLRWDKCDHDYQRRFVEHFDVPPAPATTEEDRQFLDNLLAGKEECEQEITDLGKIQSLSVSDLELKKAKDAEAKGALEKIELQICQARGDYLEFDDSATLPSCRSVDAAQIISNFRVKRDEDENTAWWKQRMADPEKYTLLECRHGEGKRGRGPSTLWWPQLIAGWLVDRKNRGIDGLSASTVAAALKEFPGCADLADLLSPPDA